MTSVLPQVSTWRVEQVDDAWHVYADGVELSSHATYADAVAVLAERTVAPDGLLPEAWNSPDGIAFAEPTGDGRDMTGVAWSWRDPGVSLLPLMFQDQTDMGHFGAKLAGHITGISNDGGTLHAEGRFYDSDHGRAARDLLLDGRRFGVSIDPGAVDATWECVAEDDDGWCTEEKVTFSAYEVIGLTMTPFPAFAAAAIQLADAAMAVAAADHAFTDSNGDGRCDACLAEDEDGNCTEVCDLEEAEHDQQAEGEASVVASLAPLAPARWMFELGEPPLGDDLLVDQGDGTYAVPLNITPAGHVFGHLARWGQCHTGYPGACVSPPPSGSNYSGFHLGTVTLEDGSQLATGTLTVGADHAPDYLRAGGARDHYAHTGLAWADVRVTDGVWGPWVSGVLRPDVSAELVRVLTASTLSGDWRHLPQPDGSTRLDLVAVLAVNTPGFPIARESLAASGLVHLATPRPRARLEAGEVQTLVAAGTVRRCPECARRALSRSTEPEAGRQPDLGMVLKLVTSALEVALDPISDQLATIERRTRHLRSAEAAALRSRVHAAR